MNIVLKRMILLILVNGTVNVSGIEFDTYNLEKEFFKVAMRLGFKIKETQLSRDPYLQRFWLSQKFGFGWIHLKRDNGSGKYQIFSCAYDDGTIKNKLSQSGWISFSEALIYPLDMIPEFTPGELELLRK